jgi:hypothetical protein
MTEEKQGRIDQLVELYEGQFRTPSKCGPQSIREFRNHYLREIPSAELIVSELIEVDLQLSWMQWDKHLANRPESISADEVAAEFARIPRLEDYAFLVGSPPANTEPWRTIAKCEMEARYAWGDAIGPVWYMSQFGIQLKADDYFEPSFVHCKSEGSDIASSSPRFLLRGRTIIGRQRSRDQCSCFSEELPTGNRIVVASHRDPKISREQLAVQLLNPQYALVTNLSNLNPVMLVSFGLLEPRQSQVVKFDFSIRLPGRRLYFASSSSS